MSEYMGGVGGLNTGMQQAAGQYAPPQPTKKDTVSNISLDFDRHIERMSKLADAMRHVSDRIDGIRPEQVGGNAINGLDPAPSTSLILDMRRKHSTLGGYISKCEDETQRLATALGIS